MIARFERSLVPSQVRVAVGDLLPGGLGVKVGRRTNPIVPPVPELAGS
jgi:hypothetical protein